MSWKTFTRLSEALNVATQGKWTLRYALDNSRRYCVCRAPSQEAITTGQAGEIEHWIAGYKQGQEERRGE